jgi:hypothetical protein
MQYRRAKNVAWRRIGGQTVVLNLDRQRMLALNESGAAAWDALDSGGEGPSAEAAAAGAAAAGAAGPAEGEGLVEFLADLLEEGVVERAEGVPMELVAAAAGRATGAPPAVVWREELHRFGGSCAMLPGESEFCNSRPTSS